MELDLVLQKFEDLTERLRDIENELKIISRQDEKILNLQAQVSALFRKYDIIFGPEGTLAKLQAKTNSCPAKNLENAVARLWGAIALIVTLIGLLKIWG